MLAIGHDASVNKPRARTFKSAAKGGFAERQIRQTCGAARGSIATAVPTSRTTRGNTMNTKSRFPIRTIPTAPAAARGKRFAVSALLIGLCVARLAGCATTNTDAFNEIVAEHQIVDNMSGS